MSAATSTGLRARLYGCRAAGIVAALTVLGCTGCASLRPDPFAVRMSDMGYMAKMDETYRRIPIASAADQAWFDGQLRVSVRASEVSRPIRLGGR